MTYIDTEAIKDPKGNLIAQQSWLWHGGDPDEIQDRDLAATWKSLEDCAESQELIDDETYKKERVAIWEEWKKFKNY